MFKVSLKLSVFWKNFRSRNYVCETNADLINVWSFKLISLMYIEVLFALANDCSKLRKFTSDLSFNFNCYHFSDLESKIRFASIYPLLHFTDVYKKFRSLTVYLWSDYLWFQSLFTHRYDLSLQPMLLITFMTSAQQLLGNLSWWAVLHLRLLQASFSSSIKFLFLFRLHG